jgi:hypothetical protein
MSKGILREKLEEEKKKLVKFSTTYIILKK